MTLTLTPHETTDRAIARKEANTSASWLDAAVEVIEDIASRKRTFTSNDLWPEFQRRGIMPKDGSSLGPAMRRASKAGLCELTGRTLKSSFAQQHLKPVREWRSLDSKWGDSVRLGHVDLLMIERTANALYKQGNRKAAEEIRKLVALKS